MLWCHEAWLENPRTKLDTLMGNSIHKWWHFHCHAWLPDGVGKLVERTWSISMYIKMYIRMIIYSYLLTLLVHLFIIYWMFFFWDDPTAFWGVFGVKFWPALKYLLRTSSVCKTAEIGLLNMVSHFFLFHPSGLLVNSQLLLLLV